LLRHRVGLAGQQRLVHLQLGVPDDRPVGKDLVTGAKTHDIAAHDLIWVEGPLQTIPDHSRLAAVEQGDLVQAALGARLLEDPHQPIDDRQTRGEQSVPIEPHGHQDDTDRQQGDVDKGEEVAPDDVPPGASAGVWHSIAALAGQAGVGLGFAETSECPDLRSNRRPARRFRCPRHRLP
jgi:hypothetical protein